MITETVALLRQLIAFPSVSSRSNLDIAHFIADTLRAAGARVDVWQDPGGQKANVFATLGPDTDGGIVLSGHMDVVPVDDQVWATDPFTVFEKQGRLYGRGTCDMKGFIAACLAYAPVFARSATVRPLHFAFTYDEEVGCLGGRALVDTLKQHTVRPSIAIIGEPTSMRIVEGRTQRDPEHRRGRLGNATGARRRRRTGPLDSGHTGPQNTATSHARGLPGGRHHHRGHRRSRRAAAARQQ